MSAIAGVVYLDGRPVNGEPERMAERLAHRGPDGSGAWTRGSVGLGHRLRHTTPESLSEAQPVVVRSGRLALVADARIDNRAELLEALSVEPRPAPISDAELILRAYEAWGDQCPERLLGDFAFAVWDERRQVLFCARDHFGAAPFYYHHAPGRAFIFASEIKALFCCPEVPRRLNEERLSDYLQPMLEDKTATFHQEIHRLAPAHRAVMSRDGIRIEEYWALDPEREIRCSSDAEYAEGFRERFLEAVRCRARSAFPVGSLLSGGLDSSSIACAARMPGMGNGEPVHTFSAVFDEVRQ